MTRAQEHRREKRLVVLFGRPQRLSAYHRAAKGAEARPVRQFVDWMKRKSSAREGSGATALAHVSRPMFAGTVERRADPAVSGAARIV